MSTLRELLQSMTSGRPSEAVVDDFVSFCRKTAVVLLRKKLAGGKLNLGHISLSVEDLALDCVADLFSRNPEGNFIQLEVYLRGIDIGKTPEAELVAHIRRLVFAKVNQGIFRIYHEIDPSLSRIIRNIKISINTLENFVVADRFGETYIVPVACNPLEHLPAFDFTVLREELRGRVGRTETVPNLMAHLACCLREQGECARLVPLVQVALMFRSLHGAAWTDEAAPAVAEMAVSLTDAREVIARVCTWVKERAEKKYVGTGKVSPGMYDRYFSVLECALVHNVVDQDADEVRYFEELSKLVPGMTKEEYAAEHKSKIEYLGRLAYKQALKELKKIF